MASGDRANTSPEDTALSESQSSQSKKARAKKAKAGSSKKMTDQEQSERFIETARKLECDESGGAFEGVFRLLLRPKQSSD
ncbi:MAG: hypothetical protein Kow0032_01150 [Methyloligellaceae bacterium]